MPGNRLKRFFAFFLLLCLAAELPAAAQLSMGEAINKAGRQRMLSQRIAKAYAMVGNKNVLSARVQLQEAVALFQKQLDELARFAKTPEEKKTISEVTRIWKQYKKLVTARPDRDKAMEVMALSEKLLAKSHQFVLLLQKRSGTSAGKLVNISGRQRMLSQRVAKYYAYKAWGFDDPAYDKEMTKAMHEFQQALEFLKKAPENTSEIDSALAKVEKDWRTFEMSKRVRKGSYIPSLVMRSMEKILQQMNYITALYAAILK
jgi:nitrate/nitrite-specific signal transduction histidine kinase